MTETGEEFSHAEGGSSIIIDRNGVITPEMIGDDFLKHAIHVPINGRIDGFPITEAYIQEKFASVAPKFKIVEAPERALSLRKLSFDGKPDSERWWPEVGNSSENFIGIYYTTATRNRKTFCIVASVAPSQIADELRQFLFETRRTVEEFYLSPEYCVSKIRAEDNARRLVYKFAHDLGLDIDSSEDRLSNERVNERRFLCPEKATSSTCHPVSYLTRNFDSSNGKMVYILHKNAVSTEDATGGIVFQIDPTEGCVKFEPRKDRSFFKNSYRNTFPLSTGVNPEYDADAVNREEASAVEELVSTPNYHWNGKQEGRTLENTSPGYYNPLTSDFLSKVSTELGASHGTTRLFPFAQILGGEDSTPASS